MVIPEPTNNQDILVRHSRKFQLHNTNHARMRESSNKVLDLLAADYAMNKLNAVLKIAYLQEEIEEAIEECKSSMNATKQELRQFFECLLDGILVAGWK